MRHAIQQVREFQEHILSHTRAPLVRNGCSLQARLLPLRRVGVCVPGAAAPLPSSAIHCVVPAQVAGVPEIAIVAPPRHNGNVHPTILGVAGELGVTEVYRIGGPQAVAALSIGTPMMPRVDKIVGPGGTYTQLAKRLVLRTDRHRHVRRHQRSRDSGGRHGQPVVHRGGPLAPGGASGGGDTVDAEPGRCWRP